jgi:hypothetical protein
VEVFRSAKPKSLTTRRREEEMDIEADTYTTPHAGPDLELLATMHAIATSIHMMQVGQQHTTHFLQVVAEQRPQNQQKLHDHVASGTTLQDARASAAHAEAYFVRKSQIASRLPIEQQMPLVMVAFPGIFRFLMTVMMMI